MGSFNRLAMPHHSEWKGFQKAEYSGTFIVPENGEHRIEYKDFQLLDFENGQYPLRLIFRDRDEKGFPNEEIIEVVDESFAYMVIKARPGVQFWWDCVLAIPIRNEIIAA